MALTTAFSAAADSSKSVKAPKPKPTDYARAVASTGPAAAKPAAPATATTASGSSSTVEVERSLAVKALASEVLQMLLPGLLKMSKTAVRKSLEDEQVTHRAAFAFCLVKPKICQSLQYACQSFLFVNR